MTFQAKSFSSGVLTATSPAIHAAVGGGISAATLALWLTGLSKLFRARFHRRQLKQIDALTVQDTQTRKDIWQAVRDVVHTYLVNTGGLFSRQEVAKDYADIQEVHEKGTREIREALSELASDYTREKSFPDRAEQPRMRQVK